MDRYAEWIDEGEELAAKANVIAASLVGFAAKIARREYHPSYCPDDYLKSMGPTALAEMADEYGERLSRKVRFITEAADTLRALSSALEEEKGHGAFLVAQLAEARRERDEARSILASTADRLNVALREANCPEIRDDIYTSFAIREGIVTLYDKGATLRSIAAHLRGESSVD